MKMRNAELNLKGAATPVTRLSKLASTFKPLPLVLLRIQQGTSEQVFTRRVIIKSAYASSAAPHQAGAYPGFCSKKRIGVMLPLPHPEWDASPSQGYPPTLSTPGLLSCPRTQHNVPGQGSNPYR